MTQKPTLLDKLLRPWASRISFQTQSDGQIRKSLRAPERLEDRRVMAADFTLLQDINPGVAVSASVPYGMVSVGSTAFFAASTPANGTELWKSDGTTAGTLMVKDLIAGPTDSFPNDLININGVLYFSAINPTGERDLWKSDGTTAGTVIVAVGVFPDSALVGLPVIALIGNNLFFTGTNVTNGGELWTSNLTTGATSRLTDINPGIGSSDPGSLTVFNGDLYFAADDGTSGRELWRTTGSTLVTTRVADIWPGIEGSEPNNLKVFGNTLYFAAMRPAEGIELWATNGTSVNLISDIVPGVDGSLPSYLTEVNGTLLFTALSPVGAPELWKTDGTNIGTVRVFNGFSTQDFVYELRNSFTTIGNFAYLSVGTDSIPPTLPPTFRAWKSDGTTLGTVQATELTAGTSVTDPQEITRVGSLTYFVGSSPTFGTEIFVTNQAPNDIVLSSTAVVENSSVGTVVGNLSTTDPNGFDSFTYTLVTGTGSTDNTLFRIVGNQLQLNGAIDFESTPALSIRLRTTDNANLTFDRIVSVTVTNLAEVLGIVVAGSNVMGSQRSNVRSITVTFDGLVDITGNPFEVRQRGGTTPMITTAFTTNTNGLRQTVATITFSGALTRGIGIGAGALLNGYYQMTIDSTNVKRSNVNLDGDSNGVAGGDYRFGTVQSDRFFALFGDADGDGSGTIADNNEFRRTNGRSAGDPLYNEAFNFDGINRIAIEDSNELRRTLRLRTLAFV